MQQQRRLHFEKLPILLVLFFTPFQRAASAEDQKSQRGILKEISLNKQNEMENLKTAAQAENLISQTEEKALKDLKKLILKFKGTSQEPDLLFRLGELYTRRAKTGLFIDLYKGEKTLAQIIKPEFSGTGSKGFLGQAISSYKEIILRFPHYGATDEVLFNLSFAHEQRGELDEALHYFQRIIDKYPRSPVLPETHMAMGEVYFQKKNYSLAQEHFEEVQNWPQTKVAPIALYKSAWSAYNLNNTPLAMNRLETLLQKSQRAKAAIHIRTEARRDLALFFSETGNPEKALSYFNQLLFPDEVPLAILELSESYEKFGKHHEMDVVLQAFLTENPQHPEAGAIWLKHILHSNSKENFSEALRGIQESHALCLDSTWKKKAEASLSFCEKALPSELHDLAVEWSERWARQPSSSKISKEIGLLFKIYLSLEPKEKVDHAIHLQYAHYLFSQKLFKEALPFYHDVGQIENLDKSLNEKALYGEVLSLEALVVATPKDSFLRQQLQAALTHYLTKQTDGPYKEEAAFKKAYLFYEDKDYDQAILWLSRIEKSTPPMKEKIEDLHLEIFRTKKDFESLTAASGKMMKNSGEPRRSKLKVIYQSAQFALIDQFLSSKELEKAALAAEQFYREHRPEPKSLEALTLSVELWKDSSQYRKAATNSLLLADEELKINSSNSAEKQIQGAITLYMEIGDLQEAQRSLQKLVAVTNTPQIRKDALEWLAEIASWYGQIPIFEDAMTKLDEGLKTETEKQLAQETRLRFFKQYAPAKAEQMEKAWAEKGLEPYASQALLKRAEKDCEQQQWSLCYQASLKLNRQQTPQNIRQKARFLQALVLEQEYRAQSTKASPERLGMVLAIKAEKFDKAIQVLTGSAKNSDELTLRLQSIDRMRALYEDYALDLKRTHTQLQSQAGEPSELAHEIAQILPLIEQKPLTLQNEKTELLKAQRDSESRSSLGSLNTLSQLTGREWRLYVPTWEEAIPQRPLLEWTPSPRSCSSTSKEKLSSLSALGRETNHCLAKNKYREADQLALSLSELFPKSPWGPFYLALSAAQQKSFDRAHWYLKLAQKRAPHALLTYEEERLNYLQNPEGYIQRGPLKTKELALTSMEEFIFVEALSEIAQNHCTEAQERGARLRSDYWKSTALHQNLQAHCSSPLKSERNLSSEQH